MQMKIIEFAEALARIAEKVIKSLQESNNDDQEETKQADGYNDLAQKLQQLLDLMADRCLGQIYAKKHQTVIRKRQLKIKRDQEILKNLLLLGDTGAKQLTTKASVYSQLKGT